MSILLMLLKIIAFTLLFLLALTVILLLTVLLVPIRYDVKLRYKESFWCSLNISWLLKIVKFEMNYDEELSTKLKIFGIDWSRRSHGSDKEDDEESSEEDPDDDEDYVSYEKYLGSEDNKTYEDRYEEDPNEEDSYREDLNKEDSSKEEPYEKDLSNEEPDYDDYDEDDDVGCESIEEKSFTKDPDEDGEDNEDPDEYVQENIEDSENESIKRSKAFTHKKRKKRRRSFIDFIKKEYRKTKALIKELSVKKDRLIKLYNNKSIRRGLVKIWKAIIKLLKLFKVRKLSGKIVYGFNDPYTTGQVTSYAALFYWWYKNKIEIIPVFDEEIIDIDIRAKGKIRLMTVTVIAAGLWFDKDFKTVYKLYKNRNKIL